MSTATDTINALLHNDFITSKIISSLEQTEHRDRVVSLLNNISAEKEKTCDKIFIITAAYDQIYKKYNSISLVVLVLSAVATLLEALRLSIEDYIEKNQPQLNTAAVSFTMNIIILLIGTIITVSSSIIRFRNYRELLEQLKDNQALLISYRDKYNKKYQKVLNLLALDTLEQDDIQSISEKIIEYDDAIKSINVLQYLRNEDIIKFNRYKAYFDLELHKIDIDKQVAKEKYEASSGIREINKPKVIDNKLKDVEKFSAIKRFKKMIGDKKKATQNTTNDIVIDNEGNKTLIQATIQSVQPPTQFVESVQQLVKPIQSSIQPIVQPVVQPVQPVQPVVQQLIQPVLQELIPQIETTVVQPIIQSVFDSVTIVQPVPTASEPSLEQTEIDDIIVTDINDSTSNNLPPLEEDFSGTQI